MFRHLSCWKTTYNLQVKKPTKAIGLRIESDILSIVVYKTLFTKIWRSVWNWTVNNSISRYNNVLSTFENSDKNNFRFLNRMKNLILAMFLLTLSSASQDISYNYSDEYWKPTPQRRTIFDSFITATARQASIRQWPFYLRNFYWAMSYRGNCSKSKKNVLVLT